MTHCQLTITPKSFQLCKPGIRQEKGRLGLNDFKLSGKLLWTTVCSVKGEIPLLFYDNITHPKTPLPLCYFGQNCSSRVDFQTIITNKIIIYVYIDR